MSAPPASPAITLSLVNGDGGATIERIDVFGYELTYAHGDYVMSSGRVVNRLPSTVVQVMTRDGTQGFGEVCPLGSTYLPAFGEGARAAIREIAPAVLGADATNLAESGIRRSPVRLSPG